MFNDEFLAYRLHAGASDKAPPEGRFDTLRTDMLSPGDTLIEVAYAGLNYKDALAQAGRGNIVRAYPRIGGIDLSGTVVESADPALTPGMPVVVHGFGIGVDADGGYAQYARVPHDWVLPLPSPLTLLDAAVLGAAGYTAALSLHWMEHCGLNRGDILVTGATGGVASIAIDMLSKRGFRVWAMSGKPQAEAYLRALGAAEVIPPLDLSAPARPLMSARWDGVVDSVGGHLLAHVIACLRPDGVAAAFGNAGGAELPTTVIPFILRGVKLLGINANSPMPLRRQIWQKLADEYRPTRLAAATRVIEPGELPQALAAMLARDSIGRCVVKFS
ncbi:MULTISPECIES: acryloyl-CoA reductase [unclassified Achromobacter]|uniref:acrylyl-CoA reductase family protein n=1 Tax=unclassified Achromobacter TaxID=2626865 RepID=UPI000B51B35C|nr:MULTISPECIES: acryloyl-CoA reductase [unclassified Achromobacter]OWT80261.1 zinc-binding dehydrogenase [Achromobacter sp. HZ34]OWT82144.1 zinc-binding dehydrogenase [Achromobacter sp. HZ28]